MSGVRSVTSEIGVALPGSRRPSDADIARSAQNMLQWITLSGSVRWDYQKQAAAAAVRYVVGATGVTDLISVGAGEPSQASRSEIDLALN